MKIHWLDMKYHKELECWFFKQGENEFMMNCGEWFNLRIGEEQGIPCRLELAKQWYVVMGPKGVKLNLRTNETYKVEV
ncbi:hypothetical protein GCM10008967_28270 [Bacillus carboniphilus]|uniref:DUF5348 domain-containing protein n=1 Tax=Bacillus carboniphilus TaxID=86663 RepID=A0ABP3G6G6_9BACI